MIIYGKHTEIDAETLQQLVQFAPREVEDPERAFEVVFAKAPGHYVGVLVDADEYAFDGVNRARLIAAHEGHDPRTWRVVHGEGGGGRARWAIGRSDMAHERVL